MLAQPLATVRHAQGKLLGKMEMLGFKHREETTLQMLTLDVIKSSEIEGEKLPPDQVRSSIARKLGLDAGGLVKVDRNVEGVVAMMFDATQSFNKPLDNERLFGWQAALFPTGRSGLQKIKTGAWRDGAEPMQVVSGAMGKERVHFEAPEAARLEPEIRKFLDWFNHVNDTDPVVKAAVAHLWFVTIHPFDDGNGRIARAMTDMQLARADGSPQRFYSMSAQIQKERNAYYEILEKTQRGTLDITGWLVWFMECLHRAILTSEENLAAVMSKSQFWEKHRGNKLNTRQHTMINKLLDGMDGKLNTSKWAKMAKCSHDTALRDIQDLIDQDILEKEEGGGRSTSYKLKMN